MAYRVNLLGGFRVEVGGRAVAASAWRQRRAADLVKLLALSPRHRLHREQLLDALWPDLDAAGGGAQLRKALHYARRALGEDAVEQAGEMLALSGDATVDVEEFTRAAEAALALGSTVDCEQTTALYAGPLLPEDRYVPWAEDARRRVESLALKLFKCAARWPDVLAIDPLDEEAHREMMRAFLDAGDRRGAIKQFERLREGLRADLGVAPDAESVALYEKALAMEGFEPPTAAERARALLAWGLVHLNRRDLSSAQQNAEDARALAMDAGLAREVGEASALLGMVAHMQGRWREVFRDEFLDSIRTPHFAPFIFDAHLCLAEFSLHGVTAHEESATFARELLGIARDASVIPAEAVALLMLGEAELLSGDLERAKADLTRAATLLGESRLVSGSCLATERLAEALTAGGRRWQARRLLSRALRQADDSPLAPHLVVRVRGAMITAAPDGGAQTEARAADEALSGRELCDPCSMGYRVAAAAAWARGGDLERARSHLDDAERVAGMWQGGPWQAAVWEARGVLRVAEGALDQAAALFREAADLFAQTGRPLDAARCRALLPA